MDEVEVGQLSLPGGLSKLRMSAYSVGDNKAPIALVTDTVDGTVTTALEVVGDGIGLQGITVANQRGAAFGAMLDALSRGNAPVVALQSLQRVIPDHGDEVFREHRRRGQLGNRFVGTSYRELMAERGGSGMRHESYLVLRLDPAKDPATVREHGGGTAGAAGLAVQWVNTIQRQLRMCGMEVKGWLPPRGLAAVIRSGFDPSSDRMVSRRGGGGGDSTAGDGGLPSGVAVDQCGPMFAKRAMSYYWHNDHFSRTWWVQEWPRGGEGAAVGFMQPLILGLPHRHTVSLLMKPIPYRRASRRTSMAAERIESRQDWNRKARRRSKRSDQRQAQDIERIEEAQVDGYALFEIAGFVSVTASSREELEAASADVESAMNESNLEGQRWIIETDQAYAMAALPLARGL